MEDEAAPPPPNPLRQSLGELFPEIAWSDAPMRHEKTEMRRGDPSSALASYELAPDAEIYIVFVTSTRLARLGSDDEPHAGKPLRDRPRIRECVAGAKRAVKWKDSSVLPERGDLLEFESGVVEITYGQLDASLLDDPPDGVRVGVVIVDERVLVERFDGHTHLAWAFETPPPDPEQ